MSGLAGVLNRKDQRVEEALLAKMAAPLKRRGPGEARIAYDKMVGLIHTHRKNHQHLEAPYIDPVRKSGVTMTGTIYNSAALREQLEIAGAQFQGESDGELILRAYYHWGEHFVKELDGTFAIALWDSQKERLLLTRDRLGIEPLYYGRSAQGLYFGSNTQSLLATGMIDTSFDKEALHFMYTLHAVVPAPYTLFKGIRKVRPAHLLWLDQEGILREERYWYLKARRKRSDWSYNDWRDAIEQALFRVVNRYMEAEEDSVGMLLSGGLDSTLISALAIEGGHTNLQTFSVGFEDAPEEAGSEFEFSDQFVAKYQTDHYKFQIPNSEALTRLPEAVAEMSEPLFGQDAIGFYLLSEKVSSVTSIVQSGQGADELFGGYFWYPLMAESREEDPLKRFSEHYFDRTHEEWLTLFQSRYHTGDITGDFIRSHLTAPGADTFMDQVWRLDMTNLITDDPVKRVDNMTQAHGLDSRMPFMDYQLVELAMSMPPEYKLAQNGKGILKDIARGRVPDSIIDRPKAYFPMPALKYVRGDFYTMMRDLLTSQKARERGLFNPDYVADLLENPEAESSFTNIQGSKLWHCALLELWLQSVGC